MGSKRIVAKNACISVAVSFFLAVGVLIVPFGGGQAQAADLADPFYEHTETLRAAYATEMMAARLDAVATLSHSGALEEPGEPLKAALGSDLPLFAGSLKAHGSDLGQELRVAVEDAIAAAESGERAEMAEQVQSALALIPQAQALLVPAQLQRDPAFTSAVVAQLLLSEAGVGEAFEESVEGETEEYPRGWAALQHAEWLWKVVVKPAAPDEQRAEIAASFDRLDQLFPDPVPPEAFVNDPEEAESPGQRIAGLLESATQASLYPDRDLGRTVSLVQRMVEKAHDAYENDQELLGLERILGAAFYYEQYLSAPIGLFAPEPAEAIAGLFEEFESDASPEEGGARSEELLSHLEQVRSVFGG